MGDEIVPKLLKLPYFLLMGFGVLFLAITAHELWHVYQHWQPESLCYDFGAPSISHVTYKAEDYQYFMIKNMTLADYEAYMASGTKVEETRANTLSTIVFFSLYAMSISTILLSYRLLRKGRRRRKEEERLYREQKFRYKEESEDPFDTTKW